MFVDGCRSGGSCYWQLIPPTHLSFITHQVFGLLHTERGAKDGCNLSSARGSVTVGATLREQRYNQLIKCKEIYIHMK